MRSKRLILQLILKERYEAASSLVEALLAIGLFSFVALALAGGIAYSVQNSQIPGQRDKAVFLAQEGIEAARFIRNNNYADLVNGNHGLSMSVVPGEWSFSGTEDIVDIYSRQVIISTVDANTKQVTVNVDWADNLGISKSVSLTEYFADIDRIVPLPTSWTNPAEQSSLNLAGNTDTIDIQIGGNYAYMLRPSANEFVVIDISNLATPVQVATYEVTGSATSFQISGNYAYVGSSDNTNELVVVNITNPLAPALAGSLNLAGNQDALKIVYNNNKIYLTRASSANPELYVVNVTIPGTPALLGTYEAGSDISDVYLSGNYAHIVTSNNSQEYVILNVLNPASITLVSSLNLAGNTDGYRITGFSNTVLASRSDGTLYSIDVTNVLTPTQVGTFSAGGNINSMSLGNSNQYLFIATSNAALEFQIVDITNLSSMSAIGSLNLASTVLGIGYDTLLDRAFLAGNDNSKELIIIQPT